MTKPCGGDRPGHRSARRLGPRTSGSTTRERTITGDDGRVFREGDILTIDGSRGEALAGAATLLEPALDDAFRTLLGWADAARDIGVRANADTVADARMAREFAAEGIGLCRTEHISFEDDSADRSCAR